MTGHRTTLLGLLLDAVEAFTESALQSATLQATTRLLRFLYRHSHKRLNRPTGTLQLLPEYDSNMPYAATLT